MTYTFTVTQTMIDRVKKCRGAFEQCVRKMIDDYENERKPLEEQCLKNQK